jgi:hypothetical protein
MIRRSALDAVGGWDPSYRYCPDYEFWVRMGLHGRFVHVRERLAALRQHGGSLSGHRNVRMAEERVRVVRELYERDDLPSALLEVRDEAFRTAFIEAGILSGGIPNLVEERFVVADRLAPEILPQGRDLQAELLNYEMEMQKAQEALRDAHEEMRRLHGEIASRDAQIDAATRESPSQRERRLPGSLRLGRRRAG